MKLWDYDSETLLPNLPTMVTFPNLHNFYEDWRKDLEAKGVDIRLNTDVTEVLQRSGKGVVLKTRPFDALANKRTGEHTGPESSTERFDELVLCVLADDSLKILGKSATWRERFVLGGAKFFDDITITHSDSKYFQKHYETTFDPELCAKPHSKTQENQIAFAKAQQRGPDGEPAGFRPMYFTKSYAQDPTKIEMSFDCSNYQVSKLYLGLPLSDLAPRKSVSHLLIPPFSSTNFAWIMMLKRPPFRSKTTFFKAFSWTNVTSSFGRLMRSMRAKL